MTTHQAFDDVVPAYALDALDRDERQAFEEHLVICERCQAALRQWPGVSSGLGLAAEPAEPPPDLRSRTLARAVAQPQAHLGRPVTPFRPAVAVPGPSRPRSSALQRWALAASVVLMAGLAAYAALLRIQLAETADALGEAAAYVAQLSAELETSRRDAAMLVDTLQVVNAGDVIRVDLRGAGPGAGATGRAFVSERGVVFHSEGLPALAGGRTYQLWVIPQGAAPVSAGTFAVNAFGGSSLARMLPAGLATVAAVAVTEEPDGGSPGPTTTPLLAGS